MSIVTTPTHPFFTQTTQQVAHTSDGHVYAGPLLDGYWVDAADLLTGDRLLNDDGSWAEVVSSEVLAEPLRAYNLTVEGWHTYFVAANVDAAPVWVHNSCFDFDEAAEAAAQRLGFIGEEVTRVNGFAKIDIIFTSEVTIGDIRLIQKTLKSQGAKGVRINTGPILETNNIAQRIERAYQSGSPYLGMRIIKNNDPDNFYTLVKEF